MQRWWQERWQLYTIYGTLWNLYLYYMKFNRFSSFFFLLTGVFVSQDMRVKIVNPNTFHVHHHHVKMVVLVSTLTSIRMNANVHQVSVKFLHNNLIFFCLWTKNKRLMEWDTQRKSKKIWVELSWVESPTISWTVFSVISFFFRNLKL